MEYFESVCKITLNISESIVSEWKEKIENQYSNINKRYYHNLTMLTKKINLLRDYSANDNDSALVLASVFQYYHFDAKKDLSRDNCEEFKLFIEQAGIEDVS